MQSLDKPDIYDILVFMERKVMNTKQRRKAQLKRKQLKSLRELHERAKFAAMPMSEMMEKLRARLDEAKRAGNP